jgi:anti-sigma regulatory factor (Ser/Thr protein kinase)
MDDSERSVHEYRFEAGAAPDLAGMRQWVRRVLDGASSEGVQDSLLLATELVTNALDHAHGVQALRVRYRAPRSPVRLEVDDPRPDLGLQFGESSSDDSRGRGLLLVDAVSRQWGVITHDDDYKTVWADVLAR